MVRPVRRNDPPDRRPTPSLPELPSTHRCQGHAVTNAYPDSWLRTQRKTDQATIHELRIRLDATERHNADLRLVNSQLRADLEQARAQLREASDVVDLLPDVT